MCYEMSNKKLFTKKCLTCNNTFKCSKSCNLKICLISCTDCYNKLLDEYERYGLIQYIAGTNELECDGVDDKVKDRIRKLRVLSKLSKTC